MPIVELQGLSLSSNGAVYPIYIGVSSARGSYLSEEGILAPTPVKVNALIDTGASRTVIGLGIAERLGLKVKNYAQISSATHSNVPASVYDVDLIFEQNKMAIRNISVVELNVSMPNIQCLLGRDALSRLLLVYNGPNNSITICN